MFPIKIDFSFRSHVLWTSFLSNYNILESLAYIYMAIVKLVTQRIFIRVLQKSNIQLFLTYYIRLFIYINVYVFLNTCIIWNVTNCLSFLIAFLSWLAEDLREIFVFSSCNRLFIFVHIYVNIHINIGILVQVQFRF